jgi:UDP-glucose 4-epimerase
MARYCVTGGCGFIGSHLVDALVAAGDSVVVVDDLSSGRRQNLAAAAELMVGDICDRRLISEALRGAQGCFHLAAIASVEKCRADWLGTHQTNLTGTITIFDVARQIGSRPPIPVVYASSAAVYGDLQDFPLEEVAPVRPLSAYGADKLGGELHGRVAWRVHGVPNTGMRFFNVYGPRQDPQSPYSGVLSIFLNRISSKAPIQIHGDGRQTRDFVFVSDVVAHLRAAMERMERGAQIFNVCTGRQTSILELVSLLGASLNRRPKIHMAPARVGDIKYSVGSPARATACLGVSAKIDIATGICRLAPAAK